MTFADGKALPPVILDTFAATLSPIVLQTPVDRPPFDGVFFDHAGGDPFTALHYPVDGALTVSDDSIEFSGAAEMLDIVVKDDAGNPASFCFDDMTIEGAATVSSATASNAQLFLFGLLNEQFDGLILFAAGGITGAPWGASEIFSYLWNQGAQLANAFGYDVFTPADITFKLEFRETLLRCTIDWPGHANDTFSLTMGLAADSYQLPAMFSKVGLRAKNGVFSITGLKVMAANPNAPVAFISHSFGQGRGASAYANGFVQRIKADYADGTIMVASAPSATFDDFLDRGLAPIIKMKPATAVLTLGTNDFVNDVPLATIEAQCTELAETLIGAGITPHFTTVAPIVGKSDIAIFNMWLKAQGWAYTDVYPLLLGTGDAMDPSLTDDDVHPNDDGHEIYYDALTPVVAALAA